MDKQILIDRYNKELEKYQIPGKSSCCPQCLVSSARKIENERGYFTCGSSMQLLEGNKTGDFRGSAKCWDLACQRPLDFGNLNPWGFSYDDIPEIESYMLNFPTYESFELSQMLSI